MAGPSGAAEVSVMKAAALEAKNTAPIAAVLGGTNAEITRMRDIMGQKGGKDALKTRLGRSEAEATETPSFFAAHGEELKTEFGAGAAKIDAADNIAKLTAPPPYTEQQRIMFEAANRKITDISCVLSYMEVASDTAPGAKFDALYRPGGVLKNNPELKGAHNFAELQNRAARTLAQDADIMRIFQELPQGNTPGEITTRETFIKNTILQDPRLRTILSHRMNEIRKEIDALEPPKKAGEIEGLRVDRQDHVLNLDKRSLEIANKLVAAGAAGLTRDDIRLIIRDAKDPIDVEVRVKYEVAKRIILPPVSEDVFNRALQSASNMSKVNSLVAKGGAVVQEDAGPPALLKLINNGTLTAVDQNTLNSHLAKINSNLPDAGERTFLADYTRRVGAMFEGPSVAFPTGATAELQAAFDLGKSIKDIDNQIRQAEREVARGVRSRVRNELDASIKMDRVIGDSIVQLLEEKMDKWQPVEEQRADEAKKEELRERLDRVDQAMKHNWIDVQHEGNRVRRIVRRRHIQNDIRVIVCDGEEGIKKLIARDLRLYGPGGAHLMPPGGPQAINFDAAPPAGLTPTERESLEKIYAERGNAYRDKLMMSYFQARTRFYDRTLFGRTPGIGLTDTEWQLFAEHFGKSINENFEKVMAQNRQLAELRQSGVIPDSLNSKFLWLLMATLGAVGTGGLLVPALAGAVGLTGAGAVAAEAVAGLGVAGIGASKVYPLKSPADEAMARAA